MILSHKDTAFPHRRRLLVAGIALCALLSPLFPAETALMRFVSPLVVILIAALVYGFMLLALSPFERLFPRIAFYYALAFYYVGIFGAPLAPLFWWLDIDNQAVADTSTQYFNPMIQVASCWATAAAAYNAVFSDMPSNKLLERPRER
jgi:hypothetical protein